MATMAASLPLLLDTNVLIRATTPTAPDHTHTRRTVIHYVRAQAPLWVSRQILREYVAVLSREQPYTARPLTPRELSDDVRRFQRRFQVADEDARVTRELLALLRHVPVGGRQVHDANIVATMLV
jgi:predicted nucleic acid-binding protein